VGRFAITRANKHPVESIKWANLFFNEAGVSDVQGFTGVALWIGRIGVDWQYTADRSAVEFLMKSDPGENILQTIWKRVTPTWGASPGLMILTAPFADSGYNTWLGEGNVKKIFPYVKLDRQYPPVRHSADELSRLAVMQTDIQSFVAEMYAKFIVGEVSLSAWPDYLQTLKKLNVDEYVRAKQAALERFNRQ